MGGIRNQKNEDYAFNTHDGSSLASSNLHGMEKKPDDIPSVFVMTHPSKPPRTCHLAYTVIPTLPLLEKWSAAVVVMNLRALAVPKMRKKIDSVKNKSWSDISLLGRRRWILVVWQYGSEDAVWIGMHS